MGWLYACHAFGWFVVCGVASISGSGEPWNAGALTMLIVWPGKTSFQR